MRIIKVWIIAIILIFTVSMAWYTSQPIVMGVAQSLNQSISNSTTGTNIATAVKYVSFAWGPILIVFILLWALISSQARDIESEVYG